MVKTPRTTPFIRDQIQTRATTAKTKKVMHFTTAARKRVRRSLMIPSTDDVRTQNRMQTRATTRAVKGKKVTFVTAAAKNKVRRSLMFASNEDVRNETN